MCSLVQRSNVPCSHYDALGVPFGAGNGSIPGPSGIWIEGGRSLPRKESWWNLCNRYPWFSWIPGISFASESSLLSWMFGQTCRDHGDESFFGAEWECCMTSENCWWCFFMVALLLSRRHWKLLCLILRHFVSLSGIISMLVSMGVVWFRADLLGEQGPQLCIDSRLQRCECRQLRCVGGARRPSARVPLSRWGRSELGQEVCKLTQTNCFNLSWPTYSCCCRRFEG